MIGNRNLSFALFASLALFACATSPRDIETPTGPIPGMVSGPLIVLGVADRATSTLSRPNAQTFIETVDIEVPLGTRVIIPVVRGFDLGFGSTNPQDLSPMPLPESVFTWNHTDHHFGMQAINIAVVDIDAPAPGATTQHARIQIGARLSDDNGDDSWWGVVRYQLIYLGDHP